MVKAVAWNREDTAEILIRSDVTPGGNIHNKASTSCVCVLVGIGGGEARDHCQLSDTTRAFLSVVTSADKNRKHCPAPQSTRLLLAGCTCTERPIVVVCVISGVFVLFGDRPVWGF